MNYEFFIASRYLWARRKQIFLTLITIISISGVALGVAALIIWLIGSVIFWIAGRIVTGFNAEYRDALIVSFIGGIIAVCLYVIFDFTLTIIYLNEIFVS